MLDVLGKGSSALIPGAGHLSAVERPSTVSRRMIEFLEGAVLRS